MRNLRIAVASLLLALVGFAVSAQANYIDVVLTKDGSTYKGVLTENRINDYIKIEIGGGSIIKVSYDNILAINKEAAPAVKPSGDGEEYFSVKAKLEDISRKDLKRVTMQDLGIGGWSSSEKERLYNETKKDNATLPFVVNLLLPLGIGSYIQGDSTTGTYQLISALSLVLGFASGAAYSYSYNSYYGGSTEISTFGTLLYVNYAASYITGLIAPWTYQSGYNRDLRTAIGY